MCNMSNIAEIKFRVRYGRNRSKWVWSIMGIMRNILKWEELIGSEKWVSPTDLWKKVELYFP